MIPLHPETPRNTRPKAVKVLSELSWGWTYRVTCASTYSRKNNLSSVLFRTNLVGKVAQSRKWSLTKTDMLSSFVRWLTDCGSCLSLSLLRHLDSFFMFPCRRMFVDTVRQIENI